MRRVRVIPVLLLYKNGLYKSVRFKDYKYIGDPINAVKIFNEKEVDELILLDIQATALKRAPNIRQISDIVGEAFMPIAYGGGITSIEEVKRILYEGVEKIILNSTALKNPNMITESAVLFGSSSVVVSMDLKKDWFGKTKVHSAYASKATDLDPVRFAIEMQNRGAGEIFINSIDNDGTYKGYDLQIIKRISEALDIPLIVCGGASDISDFKSAIDAGASAVAAGSMFVFKRPHNAVLISYPSQDELKNNLYNLL